MEGSGILMKAFNSPFLEQIRWLMLWTLTEKTDILEGKEVKEKETCILGTETGFHYALEGWK